MPDLTFKPDNDTIELPAWISDLDLTAHEITVCVLISSLKAGYGKANPLWNHPDISDAFQALHQKGIVVAAVEERTLAITLDLGEQPQSPQT